MNAELFIGPVDLSPYVLHRMVSGRIDNIYYFGLADVPPSLQEDLYLLLNAFNHDLGTQWEQRLRLYTHGLNFAISRWAYEDYGSRLSDLRLYQGMELRAKLTLNYGQWYRVKEQSWEIHRIYSLEP